MLNYYCSLVITPRLTLSICVKTIFPNCIMFAASTVRGLCCLFAVSLSSVRFSEVPYYLTTQIITYGLGNFNSLFHFQVIDEHSNKTTSRNYKARIKLLMYSFLSSKTPACLLSQKHGFKRKGRAQSLK